MTSFLRQIVAGPRARHPEAGLDLCYVTDNIVATSGPSQTYPQRAYRNPLDRLVAFLDSKHGKNWAIWEFRAEGTGYPDELVYNRIRHYPWPDHHPPPFRLVPMIIASMRNWLSGNDLDADNKTNIIHKVLDTWKDKKNDRIVVVHCKAGKGRSGTMTCSYLIAECGWTPEQALARFTERRMRPKFGPGVSIPSQLRWIGYVDRWTKGGKKYVDRQLDILEIHVWGLRNGVKLAVEGFVDEGKKIKVFHTFGKDERFVVEGDAPGGSGVMDLVYAMAGYGNSPVAGQEVPGNATDNNATKLPASISTPVLTSASTNELPKRNTSLISGGDQTVTASSNDTVSEQDAALATDKSSNSSSSPPQDVSKEDPEPGGMAVIFKPDKPIRLPTSDVNIAIERRNRATTSMGLTMVTAVAHVWFNVFFEGNGSEQDGRPDVNGVFEIPWDKLDGIKGSAQKGARAVDKIAVVWRSVSDDEAEERVVNAPGVDSPVPQMEPADWKGGNEEDPAAEKRLGLRVQSPDSADISRASSIKEEVLGETGRDDKMSDDDLAGVKANMPRRSSADPKEEDAHTRQSDGKELEAYAEKLPKPDGSGGP